MRRSTQTRVAPAPVPRSYGGQWVAWTRDGRRIAGAGKTPDEARSAAHRKGITELAYEWVPPAGELFIGGHTVE